MKNVIKNRPLLILLLAAIFCPAGLVPSAAAAGADFSGEWNRTLVEKMDRAAIVITDVTKKSFKFSFKGYHAANSGEMEGTAVFTAANKAVCDYRDEGREVKLEFALNDGILLISAKGDTFGLFGIGVYIDGEYTKDEPSYTNANVVAEILGNNAEKVKELLGESAFAGLISVMEEGVASEVEGLTYAGFINGAGMGADLLIDGNSICCLGLNLDDSFGGYTFYTNDARYMKEMPAIMKKNVNSEWPLRFMYRELARE
jgi:hypothetical protein